MKIRLYTIPAILIILILLQGASFQVSINSSLDKNEVKVGEMFTFNLEIQKVGSTEIRIASPKMPAPEWASRVLSSSTTRINVVKDKAQQILSYKVKYKALAAGEYIFPSVSLPYYNPEADLNIELKTDPVKIVVLKNTNSPLPLLLLFFLIAFVVVIVVIVGIKQKKKGRSSTDVQEESEIKEDPFHSLAKTEKFSKLEELLRGFLLAKYSISQNALKDDISSALETKEVNLDRRETILDIIDFLYTVKYTGYNYDDDEILQWIEKYKKISE